MNTRLSQRNVYRIKMIVAGFISILIVAELLLLGSIILVPARPPSFTVALSFTPERTRVNPGESFQLDIAMVIGDRAITGVDAVMKYDPSLLELIPVSDDQAVDPSPNLFDLYPQNSVNATDGVITLSAIQNPGASITGDQTLGTLTFRVVDVLPANIRETAVWFVYRPGAADDSNIVGPESDGDLLRTTRPAVIEFD